MPDATVEGSIKGTLSLDISDWVAKLAKAESRARQLSRTDPTVRVDVDSAAALSKLATVEAAAKAAGGVNVGSGGTGTRTAETTALASALGKLDAAITALDVAQEADNEEMRQASLLALRESLNMEALAAAERKAAVAAGEHAAAEEAESVAEAKSNDQHKTSISRLGLIAAAIAVLIPMIAPLGAYVVGVGGALGGMGAAGVLAVVGIKNAMKDATVQGQSYSAGLQDLKGDLNGLASTSANTMLAYFHQAVEQIDQAMPSLNDEVRGFSSQLGIIGNSVLRGVISGFQVINPLLVAGGQYVERLASGFASWTENGGLQKFVTYAENELPKVEDTLGTLSNAIMHIVESTAPLGTVTLAILKGVGDVINGMDPTVLLDLAAGAGTAFLAFKAWGLLVPIINAVSTSVAGATAVTEAAAGPIGWVVAGVSALAAIMAVSAVATNDATVATQDYTTALREDNDVVGAHVRQQVAKALVDNGTIERGKKLGISAKLLVAAALDETGAQEKLTAALKKGQSALESAGKAQVDKTGKDILGVNAGINAADAAGKVGDSVKKQSKAIQGAVRDAHDYAAAMSGQKTTQDGMATALGITAQAYATMTQKENDATTASKSLKTALDLLNGKNLSAAEAQNAFDSALANSNAHINAAGNQIDRATTSLDGMSAAAVANRGELLQQIQAAEGAAQAFRDQGGSADDTRGKLVTMKQAIEDNAVAHGEDRAAVHKYLDELFKIPATIPPTKLEVDAANALAKIQAVKDALAGLNGKSVSTQITTFHQVFDLPNAKAPVGLLAPGKRDGGTIPGFANSGTVVGRGSSRSDSVLTRLSVGEEVVEEPYATRNRSLLKVIEAGGQPTLPSSGQAPAQREQKTSERPIYMDGSLFGILREMANGEAQIVLNKANAQRKMSLSAGRQPGSF